MKDKWLFIVFAVLCLAAFLWIKLRVKPFIPPVAVQSNQESCEGPDVTTEYKGRSCDFAFNVMNLKDYLSGAPMPILFMQRTEKAPCFKVGTEVKLKASYFNYADMDPALDFGRGCTDYFDGTAEITRVIKISTDGFLKKSGDEKLHILNEADDSAMLREFNQQFQLNMKEDQARQIRSNPNDVVKDLDDVKQVYGLVLKMTHPGWVQHPRSSPTIAFRSVPGEKNLTTWLQSGGMIVDVRPPDLFQAEHFPGSINIPYTINKPIDFAAPSFKALFENLAQDSFDMRRLPKDKNAKIAFMGAELMDIVAFRALVTARKTGWLNVYKASPVFKHSPTAWKSTSKLEVGPNVPKTLSAEELLGILAKQPHAIVVDVRSHQEFAVRTLAGAKNLPFPSQATYDILSEKLQALKFPLATLAIDNSTPIIFMGADHLDWRPLHAWRFAKQLGWTDVHWFRYGLSEWSGRAEASPERFKMLTDSH